MAHPLVLTALVVSSGSRNGLSEGHVSEGQSRLDLGWSAVCVGAPVCLRSPNSDVLDSGERLGAGYNTIAFFRFLCCLPFVYLLFCWSLILNGKGLFLVKMSLKCKCLVASGQWWVVPLLCQQHQCTFVDGPGFINTSSIVNDGDNILRFICIYSREYKGHLKRECVTSLWKPKVWKSFLSLLLSSALPCCLSPPT